MNARRQFTPGAGMDERDRAVVAAVAAQPGYLACWVAMRDGIDRVYLVQADPARLAAVGADPAALAVAVPEPPRVEVFGPATELPAHHEAALLSATLLWLAEPAEPVRIARAFDGSSPEHGPWLDPDHELVTDAAERQRLLDFLGGGEVVFATETRLTDLVSAAAAVVPASLRSDGRWVWSDVTRYYLDRHLIAPDAELRRHALTHPPRGRLSPLERYLVRAALNPNDQDGGPPWRSG